MTPILRAAALGLIVLGTGAATVTVLNEDIPDLAVPAVDWEPGHALDGRVFYTTDRVVETGEVLTDELRFRDGMFQSAKCQKYCDFGWSPYEQWEEGGVIHVVATTRCPTAPHTVVFHAIVDGDDLRFTATWTTRRWYWTRQINAVGEGSVTPPAGEALSG